MAMIKCPECGKEISDKAPHCINCGMVIGKQEIKEVKISFPVVKGQLLNTKCFAYKNGETIGTCKQGETLILKLEEAAEITVSMTGGFGKPSAIMNPGDNYKVDIRGFGKIFLSKVDIITGSSEWHAW